MLGLATSDMHADVAHNPHPLAGLARIGFLWDVELVGPDGKSISREVTHNLYPTEGLNHMLNVELNATTQVPAWYVGVFEGNYTPTIADTAAAIATAATESSAFASPTVRKTWTPSATASAGTINNYTGRAIFSFTAAKTIYGGFLISSSLVGGVAGVMISIVRFATPAAVTNGSVLNVGAGCTLVSA